LPASDSNPLQPFPAAIADPALAQIVLRGHLWPAVAGEHTLVFIAPARTVPWPVLKSAKFQMCIPTM
jgi:hypothetical protein